MTNIINVDDLPWQLDNENENFSYYGKELRKAAHGKKIGATLYKLLPGKKAFPYHFHYTNEEAVFVIAGEGSVRIGKETSFIKKGDYISFPPGPEHAHQIINTSKEELIYLCISTMDHPEVCCYPDSNKTSITVGTGSGGNPEEIKFRAIFKLDDKVDYFLNET